MKKSLLLITTALVLNISGLFLGTAYADPAANKALVEKAMNDLWVNRDASAAERYWAKDYIQHNPTMGNGNGHLGATVSQLPPSFKYEPGTSIAEGDLVMLHGRYGGFGPKALIAVDIFRVEDGKIVEHWDVLQDEVPASTTKSGNAMFDPKK